MELLRDIVILAVLFALLAGAVRWMRSRYFEVQEGYAAPVKWFGRHYRVLQPGPHMRWPGQWVGPNIETRARDWILDVAEIRTHKGLPVTVTLRYRAQYAPEHMKPAELYYPMSEWTEQQSRVFMGGLQRVFEEFPRSTTEDSQPASALATVFSPFFNTPPFVLCKKLEQRVAPDLRLLGVELLPQTLVIDRINVPAPITHAYDEMVHSGFQATAAARFIQSVRAAAPGVSPADLSQLYNAVVNNVGQVHTVFTGAGFQPTMLFGQPDLATGSLTVGGAPTALAPSPSALVGPPPADAVDGCYRLTPDDMALLKALPS
jgi:hypothetical protein